jgi:hypothetical protein
MDQCEPILFELLPVLGRCDSLPAAGIIIVVAASVEGPGARSPIERPK